MGTTDFSVCELSDGMVEVLASHGDVFLGGSDWDNALADYLVDTFKNAHGVDLTQDAQAYTRILEASENAKKELSTSTSAEINLPYITVVDGVSQHLVTTITRAKFEQLTAHLVDKVIECAKEALEKADVTPDKVDCFLLVGGQTRSLALQEALTATFGRPLNKSVNPDEAVALGAVTQANIIVGGENAKDVVLLDVTPLPLGIETMGGVNTILVDENTTIPVRKTEVFSTAQDNQPSVTIHVVQGGRPMAKDNKTLGQFNLDGIMPAKRGIPQIEVSFNIDANGILTVSATDKATGKEQHITIENNNTLSKEEIERIKKEQEEFAAEDEKVRENIKRGNMCESLIYQTERSLEDLKDHITDEDRQFFNEKLEVLKKRQEEKNYDGIEQLADEVNSRWNVIATKAYASANPANGANGDANAAFNNTKDMFGGNMAGNPFAGQPQ